MRPTCEVGLVAGSGEVTLADSGPALRLTVEDEIAAEAAGGYASEAAGSYTRGVCVDGLSAGSA